MKRAKYLCLQVKVDEEDSWVKVGARKQHAGWSRDGQLFCEMIAVNIAVERNVLRARDHVTQWTTARLPRPQTVHAPPPPCPVHPGLQGPEHGRQLRQHNGTGH